MQPCEPHVVRGGHPSSEFHLIAISHALNIMPWQFHMFMKYVLEPEEWTMMIWFFHYGVVNHDIDSWAAGGRDLAAWVLQYLAMISLHFKQSILHAWKHFSPGPWYIRNRIAFQS